MNRRKPSDLENPEIAFSYRNSMRVTQIRHYIHSSGHPYYPLCPRCNIPLFCEYQPYCNQCGQALDWRGISKATVVSAPTKSIIQINEETPA